MTHHLFTFLKLFETLKGDFELVRRAEGGWVFEDIDAQKRDDGHDGEEPSRADDKITGLKGKY